jgi:hypothetical protein
MTLNIKQGAVSEMIDTMIIKGKPISEIIDTGTSSVYVVEYNLKVPDGVTVFKGGPKGYSRAKNHLYDNAPRGPGSYYGKVFDESAFHGGGIAFIDNEDISFYVDKFKPHFEYGDADTDPEVIYPVFTGSENLGEIFGGGSAYLGHCLGPPVEIDLKYLNMLLNAKKLKASVSFNFSFTAENPTGGFTSNVTSTGTIEGSFDKLELEIITDLTDPDKELGHFARRYRRDISSKVAQLNPLSSSEFSGEINEYATESYAASAGGTGGSDAYPTYFRLREFEHSLPHALPRLTFIEDVRLLNIEDINYDDNYSYSYDVSETDALA